MQLTKWLTVLFILATTLFSIAYSLNCYSCFPDDTKNCDDLEEADTRNCRDNENFCSKITLDGQTTRSCFKSDKEEGCQKSGGTVSCFCSGNYCNSAPRTGAASSSIILWMATSTIMAAWASYHAN